jgi:hypothetical protein
MFENFSIKAFSRKIALWAEDVAQGVKHLFSKWKALSSNPSSGKKKSCLWRLWIPKFKGRMPTSFFLEADEK